MGRPTSAKVAWARNSGRSELLVSSTKIGLDPKTAGAIVIGAGSIAVTQKQSVMIYWVQERLVNLKPQMCIPAC